MKLLFTYTVVCFDEFLHCTFTVILCVLSLTGIFICLYVYVCVACMPIQIQIHMCFAWLILLSFIIIV